MLVIRTCLANVESFFFLRVPSLVVSAATRWSDGGDRMYRLSLGMVCDVAFRPPILLRNILPWGRYCFAGCVKPVVRPLTACNSSMTSELKDTEIGYVTYAMFLRLLVAQLSGSEVVFAALGWWSNGNANLLVLLEGRVTMCNHPDKFKFGRIVVSDSSFFKYLVNFDFTWSEMWHCWKYDRVKVVIYLWNVCVFWQFIESMLYVWILLLYLRGPILFIMI
jgi:hypothetical protein